ncbi:MAG: right-handed parallel beta-helix repeat-containing protein [Candidatus Anstonellales archaeon]
MRGASILVFILTFLSLAYADTCYCDSKTSCNNALNNASCDVVLLTSSISDTAPIINNPQNISNKVFDCQGNSLSHSVYNQEYVIRINGKENLTIRNCVLGVSSNTNTYGGLSIWNSTNITIENNIFRTSYSFLELYKTNSANLKNNSFTNSILDYVPLSIYSGCNHTIDTTNIGPTGKPILYLHDGIGTTLENTAAYDMIILCNITNGTLSNVTVPQNVYGTFIEVSDSYNVTIQNSNISSMVIYTSTLLNIRNNSFKFQGTTILCNLYTKNATIANNLIAARVGIRLDACSFLNITNNTIYAKLPILPNTPPCNNYIDTSNTGSTGKPILYYSDTSGILIENKTDEYDEIALCNVTDSSINNITFNNGNWTYAIVITNSKRINVTNSSFTNVTMAVYSWSSDSILVENSAVNSSPYESHITYLSYTPNSIVRHNKGYGYSKIFAYNSNNITVYNNTQYNISSIYLYECSNSSIYFNTLENNPSTLIPINLYSTSSSKVYNNTIRASYTYSYTSPSISLSNSPSNTVENNSISRYSIGIYLKDSSGNNLSNNNMSNSTYSIFVTGNCDNNIDTTNLGSGGRPILYLKQSSGLSLQNTSNYSLIYLCSVSSSQVLSNTIANNGGDGILVYLGANNLIEGNTIRNPFIGIQTIQSDNNSIISNTISNTSAPSQVGIVVNSSINNTLENNSILYPYSGIRLERAVGARLISNYVFKTRYGLFLANSSNTTIYLNRIYNSSLIGIFSPTNSSGFPTSNFSSINFNYVCFNAQDFNSSNWSTSTGTNNSCDTPDGWNDIGYTGCRRSCYDTQPPVITLTSPPNSSSLNITNPSLVWNATDSGSFLLECNVTLNGTVISSVAIDSGSTVSTPTSGLSEGTYYWNVSCTDQSSNSGTSQTWQFTIDTSPPSGNSSSAVTLIAPPNDSWHNTTSLQFSWYVEDNLDPVLLCDFYIQGNDTITQLNIPSTNATITSLIQGGLSQGFHTWHVNCRDDAGNWAYSETWQFTIDTSPPSGNSSSAVTLIEPENGSTWTATTLNFSWYVEDNLDQELDCDFYLNNSLNQSTTSQSGTITDITVGGLGLGTYAWKVECRDNAGNKVASEEWVFEIITQPSSQNERLSLSIETYCPNMIKVEVFSKGKRIEGATAYLYSSLSIIASNTTENGTAYLYASPGYYQLEVAKSGYEREQATVSFSCQGLALSLAQTCVEGGGVQLTIRTKEGASIEIYQGQALVEQATAGIFTYPAMESTYYTVKAYHQSYGAAEQSITTQDCPEPLLPLDIEASYSCESKGTVKVSSEGSPMPNALVTTISTIGQVVARGLTDQQGVFFFSAPEGTYSITASKEGYETESIYLSVPPCKENKTEQNQTNQTTEGQTGPESNATLNLTLDKNETFIDQSVTVTTTANGNPASLSFVVIDPDGNTISLKTSSEGTYTLKVEKTGYYEFKMGDKSYAILLAKESTRGSLLDTVIDLGIKNFLLLFFVLALIFIFFWLSRRKKKEEA